VLPDLNGRGLRGTAAGQADTACRTSNLAHRSVSCCTPRHHLLILGRSFAVRGPIKCSLLSDQMLISRVDQISANAGLRLTLNKLLGLHNIGGFSETLFADAGDHLIGRRLVDRAQNHQESAEKRFSSATDAPTAESHRPAVNQSSTAS
jgi:hypothetical protein